MDCCLADRRLSYWPRRFLWRLDESRSRNAQLNIETVRVVIELREKLTQILKELGQPEPDQRLRQAKINNFNAIEKNLAQLGVCPGKSRCVSRKSV
jgi:hypothetical protein